VCKSTEGDERSSGGEIGAGALDGMRFVDSKLSMSGRLASLIIPGYIFVDVACVNHQCGAALQSWFVGHTVAWWQSLHFIQHVPQKGHCGRQCHHRVPFCGSGLDIHNDEVRSLDSVSAIVKVMILVGFVLVFARDNEKKTV
jgi:hypothetical protein